MILYPRLLWSSDGVEVTVSSAEEEAEKLANGYRVTAAPPSDDAPYEGPTFGAPDEGTGDEPTEGPADDETHEKKPKRKKA